jgi:hypothetical protein
LGNPETGIPIPVEQASPVMKMRRFAWLPGRLSPTALAMGTRRTLAIVWLMNVETIYTNSSGEISVQTEKATYQYNGSEHDNNPKFGTSFHESTDENVHLV